MPVDKEKESDALHEAILKRVDSILKSGEADRAFSAAAGQVQDTVAKLRQAETLDPQTLRLTVTI